MKLEYKVNNCEMINAKCDKITYPINRLKIVQYFCVAVAEAV
jgi:hypothetical protein